MLIKFNYHTKERLEEAYRKGWNERKRLNVKLASSYKYLKWIGLSDRVSNCASTLIYKLYSDGTKKLDKVFFCKDKVCPVCNRRRAVKHRLRAEKVFEVAMKKEPKARYLFVTLTIKNVVPDDLGEAMTLLTKSYHKMMNRVRIKKNLLGTVRATEITRNENTGEYHPHIHAVFMVKSAYFKGTNYITYKEWAKIWGDCLGVEYAPVVDIRTIKSSSEDLKGAVVEAIKYPVKMTDFDLSDVKIVSELKEGTFRKRQLAYTGLLKEIDRVLNDESDKGSESDEPTGTLTAIWNPKTSKYNWSDEEPTAGV